MMVAIALPRRKETGSGNTTSATESPPPTANGTRNLPSFFRDSGKASPDLASADVDLAGKQPKRSSSFGKGLGLSSLTNSMSRAGDVMHSFGRSKSSTSTPVSPGENINGINPMLGQLSQGAGNSAMGPPATPDPSHLSHFSLKLSDLVNKAFVPCAPGAALPTSQGVAAGMAVAAKNAASPHGAFPGVPKIQNIAYEGKRLPDKAKVIEIAHAVVGELRYAESVDPYLLRAASRQILKALTLFAARIDTLLVSQSKDPLVLKIPTNTKEGIHLPSAMEFNLGLVSLVWIVEDSLERCIEGDRDAQGNLIADDNGDVIAGMPHFVSEILTPVRKKMEGTILHVIQPLLAQTKASLTRCLSAAVPHPFVSPVSLSPLATPGAANSMPDLLTALPTTATATGSPPSKHAEINTQPGAIASLSSAWLRELEGRLEGARRLLIPRLEERCGQDGDGWFVSVATHLIWKGLLILTSRSVAVPAITNFADASVAPPLGPVVHLVISENSKRSPSPAQLSQALKAVGVGNSKPKNKEGTASLPDSGRETPIPGIADLTKLPPIALVSQKHCAHQLAELQTFEKLVVRFCEGMLKKSGKKTKGKRSRIPFFLSHGSIADSLKDSTIDLDDYDPDDEDELARAALAEAMHALKSTIIVLQTMEKDPQSICRALSQICDERARSSASSAPSAPLSSDESRALDAIPNLPLLQILYNRMPLAPGRLELPTPPAVFGYTWAEYERAIAGFAGGETWAQALAQRMKPEVEAAWKLNSARETDRIAAAHQAGKKDPQRTSSTEELRVVTSRAPTSLLARDPGPSDSESEASVQMDESMTRSAPTLEKLRPSTSGGSEVGNLARSSETDLTSPRGRADGTPVVDSPPAVKQRSSSTAPPAAPKFWRRTSSNGRGAFHLTLSGLSRSASPKPRGRTTSGGSETESVHETAKSIESIRKVAEFERKSLGIFAKALEFVGEGHVQVLLDA